MIIERLENAAIEKDKYFTTYWKIRSKIFTRW